MSRASAAWEPKMRIYIMSRRGTKAAVRSPAIPVIVVIGSGV
jgi:hypothetical protein